MMVRSDSSDISEYRVDLDANYPIGWCGCPDYEYNKPREHPDVEMCRCKHIRHAINALKDELFKTFMKTRNKNAKTNQQKARVTDEGVSEKEEALPPQQPVVSGVHENRSGFQAQTGDGCASFEREDWEAPF